MDKPKGNYQIIADTGGDLPDKLVDEYNVKLIPFSIEADGTRFIDDDDIDVYEVMNAMERSPNPVRTACPSPGTYIEAMEATDANPVYIVTISSKLSGSADSAKMAVEGFMQKHPDRRAFVVDSLSASAGETLVTMELHRLLQLDISSEEVEKRITDFVNNMKTYFILDTLESLMKNGRLPKVKGVIATMLSIKPLMGSNGQGEIIAYGIHRGMKKSVRELVKRIEQEFTNSEERTLVISHAGAKKLAEDIADKIRNVIKVKEILVVQTRGLSTAYAQRGGIVVGF